MRVLYLLQSFPVISETFILSQIAGLIDRGVDVRLVAATPSGQTVGHRLIADYALDKRVSYLTESLRPTWGRSLKQVWRQPILAGRSTQPWRFGRKAMNRVLLNLSAGWLAQGVDRRPDAVVAHFGPTGDLAVCMRAMGVFTAPLAVPIHGMDIASPLHAGRRLYPRLRRGAELMLPISARWEAELLRDGYDRQRVRVHHVGVRVRPPADRPSSKSDRPLRLLSVCRFVEKKGLADAVEAVGRLVHEAGLDLRYTLIGDGPEAGRLRARAEALDITDRLNFTGYQSQEQIQQQYQEHDLLLAPSVTAANGDQEGIPTVLMEAMAAGLVPVSTVHSGIPELVEDGVSGRLVPEHAPVALADAIMALAKDRKAWGAMKRAAWEKVHAEFNIERLNDRLVKLLNEMATGSTLGSADSLPDN